MHYKDKNKKYFNKTSKYYYTQGDGKFANPTYEEVIPRVIKAQPKIMLDLGCGTGDMVKQILEKEPDIQVCGLDIAENMVKKAAYNIPDGDIRLGDAEDIPWENEKFDLIVCNSSFHHYPNPKRALREMRRVLKKDGKIIFGEPTAPGLIRRVVNLVCRISPHGDYRVYNKREIKWLFKKTGFKLINFKQIDEKHYALTAKKN